MQIGCKNIDLLDLTGRCVKGNLVLSKCTVQQNSHCFFDSTVDTWPLPVATVLPDSTIIKQYVSKSRGDGISHNQYPHCCINIRA
jgi:hypothetical protein